MMLMMTLPLSIDHGISGIFLLSPRIRRGCPAPPLPNRILPAVFLRFVVSCDKLNKTEVNIEMKRYFRVLLILALLGTTLVGAAAVAQTSGDEMYAGLRWRNIGPFHGGRV